MKRLSLLALASISLVGIATAQAPKKTTKAAKPAKITCAVTKEKLDVADATKKHMYADYKGKRYFFCCAGCPDEFKKNPAKYAKTATSIPTPKK